MGKKSYSDVKAEFDEMVAAIKAKRPELGDPKRYQIGGSWFAQDYLSISQTIEVADLFSDFQWPSDRTFNAVVKTLKHLSDTGRLERFFNIILTGPDPLPFDALGPKQALEIVADFFSSNEVSGIIEIIISRIPEATRLVADSVRSVPRTGTK